MGQPTSLHCGAIFVQKDEYVLELVMLAKKLHMEETVEIFHNSESTEAKMLEADPNFLGSMTSDQAIAKMLTLYLASTVPIFLVCFLQRRKAL